MSDISNAEFDLDALMRRIRDDVARRKAAAGRAVAAAAPLESIALPRLPESSGSIACKDRYALAEFLAFQDEDFVRNAYRGVLRREPDAGGFATYLDALRQGRLAKVEVLGRMRFSAEGRRAGAKVHGLPVAFALRSARRVPVLGRMLGIVQYLYRLPNIVSSHEQFEVAFYQRQLELHRQINLAEGKIERGIMQVQRSLQDTDGATRANIDSVRAEMATAAQATALERSVEALARAKADRDELGRIADRVARKAEASQVAAVGERVEATERGLTTFHDEVRALAGSAATRDDVARLGSDLTQKAERREVEPRFVAVERALDAVATGKADSARLEALVGEIAAARREDMATAAALAAGKADHAHLEAIRTRIAELQAAKTDATEFGGVIGDLRAQLVASGRIVRDQERRLAALIEEARRQYRETDAGAEPAVLAREDEHLLDAFYAAFEDRFRGTAEDIRQRIAVYLPVIREARAGTGKASVLDIGCGRGEWLELLKENGLEARGVDVNRVTVAECRDRGLAVVEGDAIEYLRGLKADSLGAVTAIHVIEHIPFRQLIVLFDQVLRVLRPEGVAIFETPNPENLIVGACNFYYDPTHERPLPPEPTRFIAESRGFVDVSILRLHPMPDGLQLTEGAEAVRELINRVLFGAQDYALIARKAKR